jgi:hypothetical protein
VQPALATAASAAASSSATAGQAVGDEATCSSPARDACSVCTAPATEVAPSPNATARSTST